VEIELPFCDPVSISDKSVERSKSLTEEKSDIIASELRQSASNLKPSFFFVLFSEEISVLDSCFCFFRKKAKDCFWFRRYKKNRDGMNGKLAIIKKKGKEGRKKRNGTAWEKKRKRQKYACTLSSLSSSLSFAEKISARAIGKRTERNRIGQR
jgi:hypothetical protein